MAFFCSILFLVIVQYNFSQKYAVFFVAGLYHIIFSPKEGVLIIYSLLISSELKYNTYKIYTTERRGKVKNNTLTNYPIIITTNKASSKYLFTANSPDLPSLHASAKDLVTLIKKVRDIVAEYLLLNPGIKTPNVTDWQIENNQKIVWILIDLEDWINRTHAKTIRRSVTIPEYLNEWAKKNKVNVSRLVTQKLRELYKQN